MSDEGLRSTAARPDDEAIGSQELAEPGGLWRLPRFRNFWLAHTISQLGTQVTVLALPLVALLLHASAMQVGLLATAEFLPILVLGLPVGALVERLPLRPVMLTADAVRALALATVPITYAVGVLTLPLLYVVAAIVGLGTLFFDVAQMSYLPALVAEEQLADGNAKLEGSRSFGQLGGPTVGGLLIQLTTAPAAVLVDALSYAVSFILLIFVRGGRAAVEPELPGGLRREIAEGVRFVLHHPILRPLAICDAAANMGFAAILALQVLYGVRTLGLSPATIGLVLAVGNAGGLAGAVVCGWLTQRFTAGRLLIGSVALSAAGAALVPLAHGAVSFGAALFVAYVGVVVYNIVQLTLRQTTTPERLLSRTNATLRFIEWGTLPLGAALGGALVAPVGLRGVMAGSAVVCGLALLPVLFSEVRTAGLLSGAATETREPA